MAFCFSAALMTVALVAGCANKPHLGDGSTGSGDNTDNIPTPTPTTVIPNPILKALNPALAVRGASCLMCHAQVQGSLLTDFGWGEDFFGGNLATRNQGTFGNIERPGSHGVELAWQSAKISNGVVVVPKLMMGFSQTVATNEIAPDAVMPNVLMSVDPQQTKDEWSLKDYLTKPFQLGDGSVGDGASMTSGVTPPAGISGPVQEVSSLYIGAPSGPQLLALDTNHQLDLQKDADWVQLALTANRPAASGLHLVTSGSSHFLEANANAPLQCYGDILVNGTLSLNHATIETDDMGCRLYVNGSVFIQGDITYSGPNGALTTYRNLQITSSRAIVMGFDPLSLFFRFLNEWNDNAQLRDQTSQTNVVVGPLNSGAACNSYPTCGTTPWNPTGTITLFQKTVLEEAILINNVEPFEDVNHNWDGYVANEAHDYSRILLNAPEVESHYAGNFTGVIVAEIAVFKLYNYTTNFSFTFDSNFKDGPMPLLPLLAGKVKILDVTQ